MLTALVFFFSSCCPKITESSTTFTDTLVVYSTDTVTIHDTTIYKTDFNVDSLLAILNATIPTNKILSSNTNRGVTTKLIVRDGKLVCESTIDSLEAVIDSLESRFILKTITNTNRIEVKKPDTGFEKFQKWFFWVVIALGIGYLIAKTQTYWIRFIPFK
jgi:hypothetical protein